MSARERAALLERTSPWHPARRQGPAASQPNAVQRLQRTIGNRAVGLLLELLPSSRRSSAGVAVQRVGGEKIAFDLPAPTDTVIKEGQDLLLDQWKQIRQAEHDLKVGTEKTEVEAGAQEMLAIRGRPARLKEYKTTHPTATPTDITRDVPTIPVVHTKEGFSKFYYKKLTRGGARTDQLTLLKEAPAFVDKRLTLDTATSTVQYRPNDATAYVTIATLKKGTEAFSVKTAVSTTSGTARDVHQKRGVASTISNESKEYVTDSRGVLTRRYAYVEKNYWQMMEFFMTNRHEGRFQSFMKAAGTADPNIFEARDEGVDLVRGQATPSKVGTLTTEQMAVAHQKLGSGPQQRGVSLTATPKVGVTYVNTGENFRTKEGFRLKIDLAKIPPRDRGGPLLINHYSYGGVISTPDKYSTLRERGKKDTYPYKESSVHARELYLEYLKPEWIVAIESHPDVAPAGPTVDQTTPLGTRTSLFEVGKTTFGGDQFEQGFDAGLVSTSDTNATPGTEHYNKGFGQARSFVRGWAAGKAKHTADGANDVSQAALEGITVPQYVYEQSMAVRLPDKEYDMYRLGYLQGRSGVGLITSHTGLPH